ncbi:MAG: CoA transferase [Actinomycetota bacterium]
MAPLSGITIVEAANFIAGPMAGQMLADLGADVIKVEPPRGDPYRRVGRTYGDASLQFRATNQNKRSVFLDLKTEDGMAELRSLLAEADVLLTNWRPGVAERMGLSAEQVRADFPELIWVRVSGYGPDGPRADEPAYDGIIQARSGGQLSGGDVPMNTNNNIADKVSAMFAAQTITAAIHQRTRTSTGAVCDVAMSDSMAYFYGTDSAAGHRMADNEPDPSVGIGLAGDLSAETAEGYLTLSPVTGKQLRRALEVAGVGDRFGDVMDADRSSTITVFGDIISPALMQRAALEWEELFKAADVPAAAVRTFTQHLEDPQTVHNRTYTNVYDEGLEGDWRMVRFPALFDGEPAETAGLPAPSLPPRDD